MLNPEDIQKQLEMLTSRVSEQTIKPTKVAKPQHAETHTRQAKPVVTETKKVSLKDAFAQSMADIQAEAKAAAEEAEKQAIARKAKLKKDLEKHKKITPPNEKYKSGIDCLDFIFTARGKSGFEVGNYIFVGDPGCGKSTMALQIMSALNDKGHKAVYLAYEGKSNIHGVMSRTDIKPNITVFDENEVMPDPENIIQLVKDLCDPEINTSGLPPVICIDSVKNMDGGVGPTKGVREAIKMLKTVVHEYGAIMFLIGHVDAATRRKTNKKIQGPAELMQLADVRIDLVQIESEIGRREMYLDMQDKNRFGDTGKFATFVLSEKGWTFPTTLEAYEG